MSSDALRDQLDQLVELTRRLDQALIGIDAGAKKFGPRMGSDFTTDQLIRDAMQQRVTEVGQARGEVALMLAKVRAGAEAVVNNTSDSIDRRDRAERNRPTQR